MSNIDRLKEDAEFKIMMPSISKTEYVHLERSIFKGQILEEIYSWNDTILVGYYTYEICKKHNISCSIQNMDFSNRSESLCWICDYYLRQDTISDIMKKYLVGKQFNIQKDINGIKIRETVKGKLPGYIYQTAITLGNKYNMAQNTVYKYGVYSSSLDSLFEKEPNLAQKILSGALKISHDNIIELAHLSADNLKSLNKSLSKEHIEHITYSEMRHELLWKKLPSSQPKSTPAPQTDIPIKQLPKYDPDSEISGLTLTIPSWISSINRTLSNADFRFISNGAKKKLELQLLALKNTIQTMLNALKEDCNG